MKWLIHSLSGRMLLAIIGIHLLLVPILFMHLLKTVEDNYKNQFVDQIRADAQWMSSYISTLGDSELIQEFFDELTIISGKRTSIKLIDIYGNNMAETGKTPKSNSTIFVDDFYFGERDDAVYNISSMVNGAQGTQVATLYVGYDETPTRTQIERVYQKGLLLALAYLFVALITSIVFSRYFFRNLNQIRNDAHQIASGNFDKQITPPTNLTEIVEFSRDLESMRRQLVSRGKQLADREKRIRTVVENIADGIVMFDSAGVIESCNPAMLEIFAYNSASLIGGSIFNLLKMSGRNIDIERLVCIGPLEITGIRQDKKELAIEITLSELKQDGKRKLLAVLRDITERRRTEKELTQHRAELAHAGRLSSIGEIAAGLAHELNQPLAAINMYIQGCIQRLNNLHEIDETIISAMESASLQSQRAAEIIRRVRSFARKEAVQTEDLQINDLIQQALDLIELDIREHDILIRSTFSAQLPSVNVDALQIKQVLVNLLRNAIDAITDNSGSSLELVIRTGTTIDNKILVSIEDQGPGVPAELQAQLFETFFTSKPDGLGIGLAISRSIIEEHGGGIWYCDNIAGGSIFSFSLPLYKGNNNE